MRLTAHISAMQKLLVHSRTLFRGRRRLLICLATLILLISTGGALHIKREAEAQLDSERERLEKQNIVPFEKSVRPRLARGEIQFWQSTKSTRALARFKDSYFAATDGGLVQYSLDGNITRRYSVLDGLPESDLASLAPFGAKLYLGTRTRGLVAFDGENFESYRWTDRTPQAISALLEDSGRLLIGTIAGGLIEFDGRQFRELKIGPEKKRLLAVNCLAKDGPRLYAGTFADGLWIEEAGRWLHFKSADGLLSDRVVGVLPDGQNVLVASDFGLAVASAASLFQDIEGATPKRFQSLTTMPTLSSMVSFRGHIILSLDDGESFALVQGLEPSRRVQVESAAWDRPVALTNCRLSVLDGDLWMLCSDGIRRAHAEENPQDQKSARFSFKLFGQPTDEHPPSSNLINALAFDADGRLWAGSFRNGIDILSTDGRRLSHVESDATREINYLLEDVESRTMLAATSGGLLRFDAAQREGRLTTAEGLLSNSVMHIALVQESDATATGARAETESRAGTDARAFAHGIGPAMVLATSKGLSVSEQGKLRALTTVQGLPSNSLYAVLARGRSVYAGTLAGLALIESGRVVRVFKDSNSNLTHNWVTSLRAAGPRLFIGTYGGGVFELTAAGEVHSFASEVGGAVVNPNAMWSDDERLYVGTLDGVWVFALRSQKWMHLRDELPARVVLSVTGDDRHVYFGTTSGIARIEKSYLESLESGV
jgi:ligand-binding sensor domain-containing protein